MSFFEALKTGFTDTVRGIAQDPTAFAKEIVSPANLKRTASDVNTFAKEVINPMAGVVQGLSEAPTRLAAGAIYAATGNEKAGEVATKVVPPVTLPGVLGKWLGSIQSPQSVANQKMNEGVSPLKATGGAIVDQVLNNPVGTEAGLLAKPLFLGGGFILRQGIEHGAPIIKDMASKIGWTKSVSKIKEHLGSIFDATPKELAPLANDLKNVTDPVEVEKIIQSKVTDTKIPTAPEGADMFTHNVKNLNVPNEAKDKILNEVAPLKASMEKINGTPMTFTEVADQAKKTGAVLEQTIGKQETLDMAAAARNTRDAIAGFAEKAQKGALTKEDVTLLYDQFSALDSYGSDLGRRLNDLKAVATPQEFKVIEDMVSKMKKLGLSKEDFLKKSGNYDLTTPEGQLAMYQDLVKPNWEHWFDTLRMGSMLSSPATHFSNILANFVGTGIVKPILKGVEGGVDATRAILTGGERTRFSGEVLPHIKGYYNPTVAKDALKDAWKVFKGDIDVANVDLRQLPRAKSGTALGVAENIGSIPMRALESMDVFFQKLTTAAEKGALDYRISKGVSVPGGSQKKAEEIATRELFRSNLKQEGEGFISSGVGAVGRLVQAGTHSDHAGLRITSKLVAPFVRTPTNILKMGLEYNPISGAVNLIGNTDKTQQVAKILLGGAMIAPLINKGLSGEITFGYPTDPTQREAQRAAGIPEYAIKFGDHWYQYSRFHPSIAFNLAMIGAVSQAVREGKYNEDNTGEITKAMALSGLKFLSGQAYLKSLGNFMDAVQGEEGKAAQFVSNIPQQFVPFRAMLSWVNRLMSENQKEINTDKSFTNQVLQSMMLQIPGFSDDTKDRTDINGKPLKNPGAFVEDNRYEAVMNALGITTTKVTEEDMKMYKSYNEARLYKKAINAQAKEDKKNLDAFVTVVKSMDSISEKKIAVLNYIRANPQMEGKILDAITNKPRDLTYEEKQIDSMPIKDGSRAKYIKAKIDTMKTPAEKKEFLKRLAKNKILTQDVFNSINVKSGAPEPQISE